MRVSESWKLHRMLAVVPALWLAACPVRPPAPAPQGGAAALRPAANLGTPYTVASEESLLTILVYRGGALASAGHNHVVASHGITGTFYLPDDSLRSSFELHVPVATLTVDEESLRAAEHSSDFPPGIPDSARQGTREHMLGDTQLDVAGSPEVTVRALHLAPVAPGIVLAHVEITVRGAAHACDFEVHFEHSSTTLFASGEATLRQSELGLKPYSAMLGALQVQDEMKVRFSIVAHAPGTPPHG